MLTTALKQFIVCKFAPKPNGKTDKIPCDCTGRPVDPTDPANHLDQNEAAAAASALGGRYGTGFVFTEDDPYFFVDIDNCLEGDQWSQTALDVLAMLPGAFVEVSQSRTGLHVIGCGPPIEHRCKNIPLGLEMYTRQRFVALTGYSAQGSIDQDCSAALPLLVAKYFPPAETHASHGDGPVEGYKGPTDDDDLIVAALRSTSAASTFGNTASFKDLWTADTDRLAVAYPDDSRPYDASSADAALAQHLAFWTGNDAERMERIMRRHDCGLARDKWDREDYMSRTITHACSKQTSWYKTGPDDNGPPLKAASKAQREAAQRIRAQRLADATPEQRRVLSVATGPAADAAFWLNGVQTSLETLETQATPLTGSAGPYQGKVPELVSGFQYLSGDMQIEHFKGCTYVLHGNRILTPTGTLLKSEQFNALYGGHVFQLDDSGNKTTKKAWEAFTESQLVRQPWADDSEFHPELPAGALVSVEGRTLVNSYVEVPVDRTPGDVAPFLTHLAKLLPNAGDRAILLAYLAAMLQHKGVKFQWAPLIQGCEGNGKSLITSCIAHAVGMRHTHFPTAEHLTEKHNIWLFDKVFIGVEDIFVQEHRGDVMETLKPMITNLHLASRDMAVAQVTRRNTANFIFNSNHRDAIRKTRDMRRFCVFFTPQQSKADMARDGLNEPYFRRIYKWLKSGGFAAVTAYLESYKIPDDLNPANGYPAPVSSTEPEVLKASTGNVEQEITEAIEEERPGFKGGWVSSMQLDQLLVGLGMHRAIGHRKRIEILKEMGYVWHPALKDGRVNRKVTPDNGKPKLFIRGPRDERDAGAVADAYEDAQK